MIERAMDVLAAELGMDPIELRRKNAVATDRFPYTAISTLIYDSADYGPAIDRALEMVGYDGLRADQKRRRDAGDSTWLGIGVSTYTEICGLAPSQVLGALRFGAGGWESGQVRLLPTGKAMVITGTSPHGQGHATSWSQIVADRLGLTPDDVEVIHGDTAFAPLGLGTYGSRSLAVGGTAVWLSCDKIIDKAKLIAAHQLEVDASDLDFQPPRFSVKGSPDRGVTIQEIAFAAFTAHNLPEGMEPNLDATTVWDPPNFTFPFGAHVAVVEVDSETGKVTLTRYVAVDDCGNVINPMIVDGQVHGGIAQGAAQALFEEVIYDSSGNLLTGTLVDYAIPTAMELPNYDTDRTVTPSPTNPMGVKGVGEAGTIASTPAVVNAVVDALSHLGVRHIDMPCTPVRVWTQIQEATRK
jgi:carbon-monoxide dehydrogenase large subunit